MVRREPFGGHWCARLPSFASRPWSRWFAIAGLPGLKVFDPTTAEALTGVHGMPAGNAWSGVLASPAEAQADDTAAEPSEGLIVRFRPSQGHASQVAAHQDAGASSANALALSDTVRVEVKQGRRDLALAAYNARADVLYAEPDYVVHALYTPNDPQYPNQWALPKVGASAAWNISRGSSSVRVAIVDCGVFSQAANRAAGDGQAGHPDLRGRVGFTLAAQNGSQAATVTLGVLDDCGTWTTFVGGGTNAFRPAAEIQVALTWGTSPADLDVHVSGPSTSGNRFHTYWSNANAASHVTISPDDHDGIGPETLTIRRNTSTGNWVPGEYRIWAHNDSGTPGYGGSAARITVTRGGQQLGVYEVASASGTSTLGLWRAVNLTVDASGNVTLTPVQQFASGGSSTVLRIDDGADGDLQWPAGGKR